MAYDIDPDTPQPRSKYHNSYLDRQKIPSWLQDNYDADAFGHGKLEMGGMSDPHVHNGPEFLFLAMAYDLSDRKRLYLIETYTEDDNIPGTFTNFDRAQAITLGRGIGFILLMGFALRYFFHRISAPINALLIWANSLTREKLKPPPPDLNFREINQLAHLIRNAVADLVRENQYLLTGKDVVIKLDSEAAPVILPMIVQRVLRGAQKAGSVAGSLCS